MVEQACGAELKAPYLVSFLRWRGVLLERGVHKETRMYDYNRVLLTTSLDICYKDNFPSRMVFNANIPSRYSWDEKRLLSLFTIFPPTDIYKIVKQQIDRSVTRVFLSRCPFHSLGPGTVRQQMLSVRFFRLLSQSYNYSTTLDILC